MTTRLFRILTATAVAAGLAAGCSDAPGVTGPDGEALLARGGMATATTTATAATVATPSAPSTP